MKGNELDLQYMRRGSLKLQFAEDCSPAPCPGRQRIHHIPTERGSLRSTTRRIYADLWDEKGLFIVKKPKSVTYLKQSLVATAHLTYETAERPEHPSWRAISTSSGSASARLQTRGVVPYSTGKLVLVLCCLLNRWHCKQYVNYKWYYILWRHLLVFSA